MYVIYIYILYALYIYTIHIYLYKQIKHISTYTYIYIYICIIYTYIYVLYIYMCVCYRGNEKSVLHRYATLSFLLLHSSGYYLLYKRPGKETYNKETYGFTKRIVFCILYLFCSLPENSFCRVFCRAETSGLIITANGLAVSICGSFLLRRIVEETLVFLFLFILGKQNI